MAGVSARGCDDLRRRPRIGLDVGNLECAVINGAYPNLDHENNLKLYALRKPLRVGAYPRRNRLRERAPDYTP